MFEVGFTEIILIFGIALLVLGPARLPKLAADLGRWAGRARAMARQLRSQLEQEVQFDPLATNTPPASRPAPGHGTIHAPPPPPPTQAPAATAPATPPLDDVPATPVAQTVPDERKPG